MHIRSFIIQHLSLIIYGMSPFSAASVGLTSLSLLERVKLDDPDAWTRLAKLYGPLVYEWSRRCGLSAEDAADVMQEVFAVLTQRLADFRRERPDDSFRGWLWTITRNKVRDCARRAATRVIAHERLQDLAGEASEPFTDSEERSTIESGITARAIELIRPEFAATTWQAFWQATVDGRTAADIAAELGITKHAVHQAKYRVLQRLRAEIRGLV
jgi:RNA polymerase sigma factor (sigma-70 family)